MKTNKIESSILPVSRPRAASSSQPNAGRIELSKVPTMQRTTYAEKLKDPRWQKKRLEILDAADFACEDCGRRDLELQVHHCAYIRGIENHEHTIELLMSVCAECHEKRQRFEDTLRVGLGKITRLLKPEQLEAEAWRLVKDISERETARLAEAFL